jgi:hypothetical protein
MKQSVVEHRPSLNWAFTGERERESIEPAPQVAGIVHVKDGKALTPIGKRMLQRANQQLRESAA